MKSKTTSTYFGLSHFFSFLGKNNIINIAVATIISRYIMIISIGFIDHIILPIINRDMDNDGTKDIHKLENYKFRLWGITFEIGAFCVLLFKFMIIMIFMFIISKLIEQKPINVITTSFVDYD